MKNVLFLLIKTDPRSFALATLLMLVIKSVEISSPFVFSKSIEFFLEDQIEFIFHFLLLFSFLTLACSVLIPVQCSMSSKLIKKCIKDRSLVWNRIIFSKPYHQIRNLHRAEVIEAFYRARCSFAEFSGKIFNTHLVNFTVIASILLYILFMKIIWVIPITLASALLMLIVTKVLTKFLEPMFAQAHSLSDKYNAQLADLYDNAAPIKMMDAQVSAVQPFRRMVNEHLSKMTSLSILQIIQVSSSAFIVWLLQGIVLFSAIYLFNSDLDASVSEVLGAYFYSSMLIEKIKSTSEIFYDVAQWKTSRKALEDILCDSATSGALTLTHQSSAQMSEHKQTKGSTSHQPLSLGSVKYQSPLIIHPFTLTVSPDFQLSLKTTITISYGSKVAIIGPSGSGKTTLLELISGNIPLHRAVTIGEHDLVSLSPLKKSKLLSLAEAELKMLSGTFKQAILLGQEIPNQAPLFLESLELEKFLHFLSSDRVFPKKIYQPVR